MKPILKTIRETPVSDVYHLEEFQNQNYMNGIPIMVIEVQKGYADKSQILSNIPANNLTTKDIPKKELKHIKLISKYLGFFQATRDIIDIHGNVIMKKNEFYKSNHYKKSESSWLWNPVVIYPSTDDYKIFIQSNANGSDVPHCTMEQLNNIQEHIQYIINMYKNKDRKES